MKYWSIIYYIINYIVKYILYFNIIYWNRSIDLQSNKFTGFYWKVFSNRLWHRFSPKIFLFMKQSNIDSLKISYFLTLHLRLNSSKWKDLYWVECLCKLLCVCVLKQEGLNCKKRRWHVNLDPITFQQKSHENFN